MKIKVTNNNKIILSNLRITNRCTKNNNYLNIIVEKCHHRWTKVNTYNLDDMDQFFGSQYYSTTQGLVGLSEPVEDESLVKRKTIKRRQQSNRTVKEISEPWSPQEEITLCKALINVFENRIEGNAKKVARLWTEVLTYIEKEEI
jgi:hypothetical protein